MMLALRLALIAAAMIGFLTAMVARHADLRANGTEILLPMEPVDPRDLLLGHYVAIQTPIHQLDLSGLDGPTRDWTRGQTLYVSLMPGQDGAWRPVSIAAQRPSTGVFVQGRVRWATSAQDRPMTAPDGDAEGLEQGGAIPGDSGAIISASYNLERYYAPAEDALALEAMRQADRLRLIVSVGADGAAVIKGLEIDGQARYDTLF